MNFCNYALHIEGVLDDQVETYTNGKAVMNHQVTNAGNQLVDALGVTSNVTYTTPLK
jgi:hypothetical protein